ncbi:MAG TPA: hypothetical protein VF006_19050 [Longimicrobium sp.]
MSAKVSLFAPVKLGEYRYLFVIIGWNDYATQLKEEMAKQLDAFGADLRTSGLVLQAYKASEYQTYEEIRSKNWPPEFRDRLSNDVDPCMLIIDRDFAAFDPSHDRWAVVWFSELSTYAQDLPRLFHKLATLSRAQEDVFQFLKRVTLKAGAKGAAKAGRIAKYFEIKPQIFGVSLDVGKILEDVSDVLTR